MLLGQILIIILLLLCSASFSGFEAALFTFPRIRLQSSLHEKKRSAAIISRLLARPRRILVTLIAGNLLVNVGASSVLTLIVIHLAEIYGLDKTGALIIEFIFMSYVLLVVGEITPKAIAVKHYEFIAYNWAPAMNLVNLVFTPLSATLDRLSSRFLPRTEAKKLSAGEINLMLQEARTANIIEEDELAIAWQLLGLSKRTVAQAMTPATEVIGIRDTATIGDARKKIHRCKHSRLVVFEGATRNVLGLLYGKDIVFLEDALPAKAYLREPYFIPESKNLESLLNEFRRRGLHVAVVNDEFGEFAGLLTLQDIIESLVGEIVEDYAETAGAADRPSGPDRGVFGGEASVQSVFRALNLEHLDEGGERLSAFLLRNLGHLPKEGESLSHRGLIFTVKETKGRKIKSVIVARQ